VKRELYGVMFLTWFSVLAMAQIAPTPTLKHGGQMAIGQKHFSHPGAPTLCHGKCPFYGGDIDLNDPNANEFANANTLLVSDTQTYSAMTAPTNGMVTGMLINQWPTNVGKIYDPAVGVYDVRIGVSTGNPGTSVGGGQNKLFSEATGRIVGTLIEYSVASKFTSPIPIEKGTTYWFNYLPQCTDGNNPTCSQVYYFESNTDGLNGVNAQLQPSYESFFNSAFFGVSWENWCDYLGSGPTTECQGMSFALAGN
jgi:hypothetical protein